MLPLLLGLVAALPSFAACTPLGQQPGTAPNALATPEKSALTAQDGTPPSGEAPRPAQGRVITPEEREVNRPKHVAFDDPAAVEAGRAMLERSLFALGAVAGVGEPGSFEVSVPLADVLPGLVHQSLFTEVTLFKKAQLDPNAWRVHSRVPMLVRNAPNGDGYAIGEYVAQTTPSEVRFVPVYTRYAVMGERAWTERAPKYDRRADAEANARWHVMRNFVVGAWPVALQAYSAELAALGSGPDGDPLFELRFDRKWRPLEHEWIKDYYLVVDDETLRPRQLQFHVVGNDRAHRRSAIQWAYADFDGWTDVPLPADLRKAWEERLVAAWKQASGREGDGEAAVESADLRVPAHVTLPSLVTLWRDGGERQYVFETARHGFEPLPAGSLGLPWQMDDRVWSTAERADAWDPPPQGAPVEDAAPGSADAAPGSADAARGGG